MGIIVVAGNDLQMLSEQIQVHRECHRYLVAFIWCAKCNKGTTRRWHRGEMTSASLGKSPDVTHVARRKIRDKVVEYRKFSAVMFLDFFF